MPAAVCHYSDAVSKLPVNPIRLEQAQYFKFAEKPEYDCKDIYRPRRSGRFLHDWRATLIPSISIIVSLVGTFAFLYAVGFTLNMLTLFAIVLVIGTVVDDSVVVVEAVQAKFDGGENDPYHATVSAMGGLSAALITTTIVFMAVFIPVCFMGGTSGTFYKQFGLTMAVAVGISLINAMTLCPALSALLMRPSAGAEKAGFMNRFHYAFDQSFTAVAGQYRGGIMFLFRNRWIVRVLFALSVGAL